MADIVFKDLSAKEQLELIERQRARLAEIRAAIDAIVGGAISASISTAGGSRSFTRASLKDLRELYAAAQRRYRQMRRFVQGTPRTRRIYADWSGSGANTQTVSEHGGNGGAVTEVALNAMNKAVEARDEAVKAREGLVELNAETKDYVDTRFPAAVQAAEKSISDTAKTASGQIDNKVAGLDATLKQVVDAAALALDGKVATASGALDQKVVTASQEIDQKLTSASSALDQKVAETSTALNAQVAEVNRTKEAIDATAKTVSDNATKATTAAEDAQQQAAAAQQSAEGLAERLEDLHGISGSPSVSFRDVGAELYAYGKWDPAVYTVELRGIHSTDRGNLICVANYSSLWMRLYVVAPNGEVIANQSLGSGQYTATFQIVRHGDRYLVLLNSACYAVTEKVDDAGAVTVAITSLGAIDFDGYGTSVGAYSAISTVVIGDRAILSTLVLDLINLKVVQKLSASVSFARGRVFGATESVIATLSDGTMTQLSLDADGLVVRNDYKDGTSALYKNSCILDFSNISGTTTRFSLLCATPNQGANLAMFSSYSDVSMKYQTMTAPVPVGMTDLIARGRVTVAIGVDGLVSIFRFYGVTVGQRPAFGRYVVQFDSKRRPALCGIDEKGVWLMNGCIGGWGGYRPTQKLTRIEW